ncbi:DUF6152 family protein [Pedomonas mirosovicensis]|uniref:DUF6152 family protein n=1 Tax=Pedomonas mirosovicensis TaxID=2908641 RepID=UPI00216A35B4|nr:DUF6152 family protein [Pedomonas mirosovicensis]MCH8686671.1 DUF6152 family protein [Pedomonas mirosovicensis]
MKHGFTLRIFLGVFTAAGLSSGVPNLALAHHGWSSYDASKIITLTAQLQDVVWRNPHAEAKVDYSGETWVVVLAPISRMEARGLTKDMLKNGVTATLEGYPRSDGTPEMRLERITVNGKTVELR